MLGFSAAARLASAVSKDAVADTTIHVRIGSVFTCVGFMVVTSISKGFVGSLRATRAPDLLWSLEVSGYDANYSSVGALVVDLADLFFPASYL